MLLADRENNRPCSYPRNTLLLEFTDRCSGRILSTPISYHEREGVLHVRHLRVKADVNDPAAQQALAALAP